MTYLKATHQFQCQCQDQHRETSALQTQKNVIGIIKPTPLQKQTTIFQLCSQIAFTLLTAPICFVHLKLLPGEGSKWFLNMSSTWEGFLSASCFYHKGWKTLPGEPVKLPQRWLSLWRQKAKEGKGARGSCCSPKGTVKMSNAERKQ